MKRVEAFSFTLLLLKTDGLQAFTCFVPADAVGTLALVWCGCLHLEGAAAAQRRDRNEHSSSRTGYNRLYIM